MFSCTQSCFKSVVFKIPSDFTIMASCVTWTELDPVVSRWPRLLLEELDHIWRLRWHRCRLGWPPWPPIQRWTAEQLIGSHDLHGKTWLVSGGSDFPIIRLSTLVVPSLGLSSLASWVSSWWIRTSCSFRFLWTLPALPLRHSGTAFITFKSGLPCSDPRTIEKLKYAEIFGG